MYLSRLKLNPFKWQTRQLRINPYLLHQAIYMAFPDDEEGGPGRILYRTDTNKSGTIILIVQSEKAPDWDKANMISTCLYKPAEFKTFSPKVKLGQKLYFRLRTNPTKRLGKSADEDHGKRVGIYKEEEQIKWLERKAKTSGFNILSYSIVPEGKLEFKKNDAEENIKHNAVRFEGLLEVNNPDIFLKSVENGIGTAKGFGFGLLSIAPVKE
jgi:CRISPR system Cascade subunit CasE